MRVASSHGYANRMHENPGGSEPVGLNSPARA
ncbi:uncharacterized protein METZ01_LOCUS495825 [marine metagenome]|uniref:Uncharacterized protein n=1 Tax=marine metagenome TaxID=408172 RepID=A0A383DF06_9ZZZZ